MFACICIQLLELTKDKAPREGSLLLLLLNRNLKGQLLLWNTDLNLNISFEKSVVCETEKKKKRAKGAQRGR